MKGTGISETLVVRVSRASRGVAPYGNAALQISVEERFKPVPRSVAESLNAAPGKPQRFLYAVPVSPGCGPVV